MEQLFSTLTPFHPCSPSSKFYQKAPDPLTLNLQS